MTLVINKPSDRVVVVAGFLQKIQDSSRDNIDIVLHSRDFSEYQKMYVKGMGMVDEKLVFTDFRVQKEFCSK
jgi:hypothetical protein